MVCCTMLSLLPWSGVWLPQCADWVQCQYWCFVWTPWWQGRGSWHQESSVGGWVSPECGRGLAGVLGGWSRGPARAWTWAWSWIELGAARPAGWTAGGAGPQPNWPPLTWSGWGPLWNGVAPEGTGDSWPLSLSHLLLLTRYSSLLRPPPQ